MQPTAGTKTQDYNTYPQASGEPWGHTGNDYRGNIGDAVVTIANGTVIWADWGHLMPDELADKYAFVRGSGASGIVVLIQHDGWVSVSAHLSETPLNPGDVVKRGQRIGSVGNTSSRVPQIGPHLHYECIAQTHVFVAPFGRYNPDDQITHEDAVAAAAATAAATRTVTSAVAWVRTKPTHRAPLVSAYPRGLAKGAKLAVVGYVKGSDPFGNGNDAWYKTRSGYYVWANTAGNSLAGLAKL